MATIVRKTHTDEIEDTKLTLYDDGMKPVIELTFPTADSAAEVGGCLLYGSAGFPSKLRIYDDLWDGSGEIRW
jgi:hypothetical protein